MISWAEIYANTEILSPVDRETWQIIGESARLGPRSRVVELASGKGAFAAYLAMRFDCSVEGFDINKEFVDYSNKRAIELGLEQKLSFTQTDVNQMTIRPDEFDLGSCFGALYMFRDPGWKNLMRGVKPGGYIASSDLVCKKIPAPREIMEVFFEEPGQPLTLEDTRRWYTSRGVRILREVECSQKAWIEYYDLQKKMLQQLSIKQPTNQELQAEVKEELRQDRLVRQYSEEYMNYVTFIMQKT